MSLDICRICLEGQQVIETFQWELICPCNCKGSVKYVHRKCLEEWRNTNYINYYECSICKFEYILDKYINFDKLYNNIINQINLTEILSNSWNIFLALSFFILPNKFIFYITNTKLNNDINIYEMYYIVMINVLFIYLFIFIFIVIIEFCKNINYDIIVINNIDNIDNIDIDNIS